MNMKQFRYVFILVNAGSFSRATEELNISQPSLSQYVKNRISAWCRIISSCEWKCTFDRCR